MAFPTTPFGVRTPQYGAVLGGGGGRPGPKGPYSDPDMFRVGTLSWNRQFGGAAGSGGIYSSPEERRAERERKRAEKAQAIVDGNYVPGYGYIARPQSGLMGGQSIINNATPLVPDATAGAATPAPAGPPPSPLDALRTPAERAARETAVFGRPTTTATEYAQPVAPVAPRAATSPIGASGDIYSKLYLGGGKPQILREVRSPYGTAFSTSNIYR